ncbi:MAG: hypothetical protein JWM72_4370 [Actinomycetia bacterium]|nr:hypothetical protein [Actinomycetes bacterium]
MRRSTARRLPDVAHEANADRQSWAAANWPLDVVPARAGA